MVGWRESTRSKATITVDGDEEFRVVDDPGGANERTGKVTVDAVKDYVQSDLDLTYLSDADAASTYLSKADAVSTYQPVDTDLTAISGLTPSNNDVLQYKTGAWANRTLAQLMTDLAALGTTFQPLDSDLTAIAALTTTSYGRALLELANAAALTAASNAFVGDSGSGGTKGMVPAPASGDAAGSKFLSAAGGWATPSGAGDVSAASSFGTDNRVIRSDGTGKGVQSSGITIDDSDNVSGMASLLLPNANGLRIRDSDASHYLGITPPANLTANRTFTLPTNDEDTAVNLGTWATWSPTFGASSGTYTSIAATYARYCQIGKLVHFDIRIAITTNGTAAGYTTFTLPVTQRTNSFAAFVGNELSNAKSLFCGSLNATTAFALYYDGTYAGANGRNFQCSGTYEAA